MKAENMRIRQKKKALKTMVGPKRGGIERGGQGDPNNLLGECPGRRRFGLRIKDWNKGSARGIDRDCCWGTIGQLGAICHKEDGIIVGRVKKETKEQPEHRAHTAKMRSILLGVRVSDRE